MGLPKVAQGTGMARAEANAIRLPDLGFIYPIYQ